MNKDNIMNEYKYVGKFICLQLNHFVNLKRYNYKEKLISILEGYETTLKMAMRDVKELKTIYVK